MSVAQRASGRGVLHRVASGDGSVSDLIRMPFRELNLSRWSDGTFGVLYGARDLQTAIIEHGFHLSQFLHEARAPRRFHPRVHFAFDLTDTLCDVRREDSALFDPSDYTLSQRRGRELYLAGVNGVLYPSVRNAGGVCAGIFKPEIIAKPAVVTRRLGYLWDGAYLEPFQAPVSPIIISPTGDGLR